MKKFCLLLALVIVLGAPAASLAQQQDSHITRADFIKEILTQTNTEIDEVTQSSFSDVTDPELIPYIETAYKNGIVSGYGDYFAPGQSITKEEAVKIIVDVFGEKAGLKEAAKAFTDEDLEFADSGDISPWAKPYIAYALKTGLITKESDSFGPQTPFATVQAGEMIASAKDVYQRLFTRNELSAPDMLVRTNEKLAELGTYKQKGTMLIEMQLFVEGLTLEQIEENEELEEFIDGGIDMSMDMDISFQAPDRIYIKQSLASDAGVEEVMQDVETFMDGSLMYQRMAGSDKWVMQDLGSVMEQIQVITDREPYQMAQLSEDELKMFKEFARYEDDIKTNDGEYYVISFNIDKEAYREYYMEIMEKVMDSVVTLQAENPQLTQDPDFDPDQYKQMMTALVSGIEVELSYKYYIDKETQLFEKVWMSQDMTMPMDQFMAEAIKTLSEDAPAFSVKVQTYSEGEFEIYDFDEEVEFPVITEEDIMDQSILLPVEPETPQED
ncbi:MAG: S-layer homology domain-containing protein [Firmicutes bacterium]|nr:S-layer homology domain-containing protein [Bacillota bacterium]